MNVTAWSNGNPNDVTGAGYGIRLKKSDRDNVFNKKWNDVIILVDKTSFKVPISDSFWRNCTELRSAEIGMALLTRGLAPWTKDNPPKLTLTVVGRGRFELIP